MRDYLLIALGGAVGSVARFRISEWMLARFGGDFPLGTLLVNVTGSFLIGFLANWPKLGVLDGAGALDGNLAGSEALDVVNNAVDNMGGNAVDNTVSNLGASVNNASLYRGNTHGAPHGNIHKTAHAFFGHPSTRMLLITGLCGGYTTFSTFSLQTLELAHKGAWFHAGANAIGSMVACLIAVWLGHALAGWIRARVGG